MKHNIRFKILTIIALTLGIQSSSSRSCASTSTLGRGIQLAGPALPAPKLPKNPPNPASLQFAAGPALPAPKLPKNPPNPASLASGARSRSSAV